MAPPPSDLEEKRKQIQTLGACSCGDGQEGRTDWFWAQLFHRHSGSEKGHTGLKEWPAAQSTELTTENLVLCAFSKQCYFTSADKTKSLQPRGRQFCASVELRCLHGVLRPGRTLTGSPETPRASTGWRNPDARTSWAP